MNKAGIPHGKQKYCVVFHIAEELVKEARFRKGDKIELVHNPKQRLFALQKSSGGGGAFYPRPWGGTFKTAMIEPFDHLPKNAIDMELTFVDCEENQVLFQLPPPPQLLF